MEKAILVVDMPNDCSECEYLRRMQYGQCCILCDVAPRISNHRPSWCPLKPIPEKEKESDDSAMVAYPYTSGKKAGWNACIDAICGKEG